MQSNRFLLYQFSSYYSVNIFQKFYKNVGIDLGTTNTRLYLKGEGIVINEPTLVAINSRTSELISVGNDAKKMVDRTPAHINLVRPLTNGVISDFEVTEQILKHILRKVGGKSPFAKFYLAAISVPTNLTEVERKSVEDAVSSAGASKVYLVETPIAAAIGARLPVEEPISNMIVDIGGGTTEISIISVGGAVKSKSLKIAGDKFNEDIIRSIKEDYQLLIGEPTAEELKVNMSSLSFNTDHGIFNGEIMLYVNDTRHLDLLISKLEKVEGAVTVSRFDSRSN